MENLNFKGMTMNHASAAITITGGAAATIAVGVTTVCAIDGKFATALANSTPSAVTTDSGTAASFVAMAKNKATVLVVGLNAAGSLKLAQGSVEDTQVGVTTTVGAFINAPAFPRLPDDFCPLAYMLIRSAPDAAAFTISTSNWNATGITVSTVVNVATLPARPQTA